MALADTPKILGSIRGPLKALLAAELEAGNEIAQASTGDWPAPSVTFIKLRYIFITASEGLNGKAVYTENW